MEGRLDRASPRGGSLTSLHRYNTKQTSPSNTLQISSNNLICKDLDRFTRYFIVKAVQVIVQSRLNGNQRIKTECKHSGNDWFNLDILDIVDLSDKTKFVLDTEGLSIKANWHVCCEISLRTDDGVIVLERWIISNKTNLNQKPSTSLTNVQASNPDGANIISESLSANAANNHNGNKSSNRSTPSIYATYNKMTLLLKTVLTTAHIVPAYRVASQSTIGYKIYAVPRPTSRGSLQDVNLNSIAGEFIAPDELDHFCPILRLGSIKTDINELDVSLCYRKDTRSASYPLRGPRSRDLYNRVLDEDCLVAAKQLLAGHAGPKEGKLSRNHIRTGSSNSLDRDKLAFLDQPLRPAFASSENGNSGDKITSDRLSNVDMGDCALIESAFERLLQNKTSCSAKDDDIVNIANEALKLPTKSSQGVSSNGRAINGAKSEPIQVPCKTNQLNNLISTTSSTPKSLSDSYVFVDLNPPFASDEQNDMNSFFHGPTPTFANGLGSLKDVDDLTSQLATIEANASQIDEFVDNICVSEDDEESGQK